MSERTDGRPRRSAPLFALVAVLVLVVPGFVLGSALTVTRGSAEHGNGLYVLGTNIGTWWTALRVTPNVAPSPTPPLASLAIGSPTVLPNATAQFLVDGGGSGTTDILWQFSETINAPLNAEIEISLNASVGSAAPIHVTVYFQTQSTTPTARIVFNLYFSVSSTLPSTFEIQDVAAVSTLCPVVGTCP